MPKQYLDNFALTAAAGATPQTAQATPLFARIARGLNRKVHEFGVALAGKQGGAYYQNTPDRLVFENIILPFYQLSREHRKLLFVGCDWYTAGYARLFALKAYTTIDPDPGRACYGASHHQIAPMRDLGSVHPQASLDVIICNGVIGWGLDEPTEAEASFEAAYTALRPGGHLVVGWNDLPRHAPFKPADIVALKKFDSYVFPPLGADRHRVDHELRHTFEFFAKPV